MDNTRRNMQVGGLIALLVGLVVASYEAYRVYASPVRLKTEVTEEQAREERYHTAAGVAGAILALGGGLVTYAVGTSGSKRLTSYRQGTPTGHVPQH